MTSTAHRSALITGAGRRIGRAVALDLASKGWSVAVHYGFSADEAGEVVETIIARGGRAIAVEADLADQAEVEALMQQAAGQLGGAPRCLINNASLFEPDDIGTLSAASWERHLAINLKAPVFLAQAMYRLMPPGEIGNIINIIDQRVWRLTPEFFSYTISKAGLWTATQTLAQALAPRIRVNAVGPGPTLANVYQSAEDFAAEAAATPLGRGTSPEEIAAAVQFILASPSLTGQMLALDGGQHLDWRGHAASASTGTQKP